MIFSCFSHISVPLFTPVFLLTPITTWSGVNWLHTANNTSKGCQTRCRARCVNCLMLANCHSSNKVLIYSMWQSCHVQWQQQSTWQKNIHNLTRCHILCVYIQDLQITNPHSSQLQLQIDQHSKEIHSSWYICSNIQDTDSHHVSDSEKKWYSCYQTHKNQGKQVILKYCFIMFVLLIL